MKRLFSLLALIFSLSLVLAACSGGGGGGAAGGGGGGGTTATTTTVSGKVTLSSTVSGKPAFAAKMASKLQAAKSKTAYQPMDTGQTMQNVLSAAGVNLATALATATVELYDADKPEWLYPVAVALSDGSGNYSLSKLMNMDNNANTDGSLPYTDNDDIPTGKYTVIASKYDSNMGKLFVAVQAVVKNFAGTVAGNDLVAQDSDAVPTIVSMLGLPKNSDGTYGSSTTALSSNSAIQITFSMAMARLSVIDAANIKDSLGAIVPGKWKVSADLVTVTFYPTNTLTPNTVYSVSIGGGSASKTAKNVYGKKLAATGLGTFKIGPADNSAPNVIKDRPNATLDSETSSINSVRITSPIRIATDEPLDVDSISVSSSPSIGDKPFVKFIGKLEASKAYQNYYYIYEIVPANSLSLGTPYTISISGIKDLAGNALSLPVPITFTTEASSAGVVTAGQTTSEVNAQLAVKDVFGKWINAMNSRNASLLTSYMSGDFYWLNDETSGSKQEDQNRDGRMSLNEFSAMLQNWFVQLEHCGSTVTGSIVGNITLTSATTANIAFTMTATPTNTTDPYCSDNGPQATMYATVENINSAWLMTRGADFLVTTWPAPLKVIDLTAPTNGTQLPDPAASPLTPDFQWTVPATTDPITTYLVVLIDNKSPYQETGWAAIVDAGGASAGDSLSTKFNPVPGDYGNVIVLGFGDNANNPFGFSNTITEIKAGGDYSWAVLGFKTKTLSDFKVLNFDPVQYLNASSAAINFTVGGAYRDISVVLLDTPGGTAYTFSDNSNGYNVTADTVYMTVTTPNTTATTGCYMINGYTYSFGALTFTNGVSSPVTLNLSHNRNWVEVSDTPCNTSNGATISESTGLWKQFGIFTSGGAYPMINIVSVSGKTCSPVISTSLGTMDSWGNFPQSADVCTVDITVNVSTNASIGDLNVNVWNDNGNGQYSKNIQPVTTGTNITISNVPVYNGRNWININGWDNANQINHTNGFSVETAAGSTYVAPITVNVTGATATSTTSMFEAYYSSTGNSATISYTMAGPINASCVTYNCAGWSQSADPNWSFVQGGPITATSGSFTVTLYNGWNYIDLGDGMGNWYRVYINTTGGAKFTPPNAITQINEVGGGNPLTPSGYTTYNTTACSVVITGTTTASGPMNVYLNNYNSAIGSISEWQQVTPTGSGPYSYSFTQPVYNGDNDISVNDANYNWAGLKVTVTGSGCAPTVFNVTSIMPQSAKGTAGTVAITPDIVTGDYNAGNATQYITIKGTAKVGKLVTLNVSGYYYATLSATAASDNTFTFIDVPVYAGYNYLSISDGNNWVYKNVYTNGTGATWTPPFVISAVTGGTYASLTSGGGSSDTWASWNTDAGTVTITGTSTVDGAGTWSQSGSYYGSGTLTVSGGSFTLSGLQLGYGWNYFYLYDANWNYYSLSIYTTGGYGAQTQYVKITSPAHDATVSGPVTVSGTIQGFSPTTVYGYVYDYSTYTSTYFSSNPSDLFYGYQSLTYSAGAFSFNTTVTAGNTTDIEVWANDASGINHGHYIYVNNSLGYTPYFYKPSSQPSKAAGVAQAHKMQFLRHITR